MAGTSNQLTLCTESSIGRNVAHLLYGFDTENPWKHFTIIIIIMQNLYSAISVSSMALCNSCNFKKEIHLSY